MLNKSNKSLSSGNWEDFCPGKKICSQQEHSFAFNSHANLRLLLTNPHPNIQAVDSYQQNVSAPWFSQKSLGGLFWAPFFYVLISSKISEEFTGKEGQLACGMRSWQFIIHQLVWGWALFQWDKRGSPSLGELWLRTSKGSRKAQPHLQELSCQGWHGQKAWTQPGEEPWCSTEPCSSTVAAPGWLSQFIAG